jgi:hypothetical protein
LASLLKSDVSQISERTEVAHGGRLRTLPSAAST